MEVGRAGPDQPVRQALTGEFGFNEADLEALRLKARADIDDAIAFGKESPEPEMAALWKTCMRDVLRIA